MINGTLLFLRLMFHRVVKVWGREVEIMNPHFSDVYTTNIIGGVDWADQLRLYVFLCGSSICFGFVLIWLPITHIFWSLKAVWNVCLELEKGNISYFNSWKPPTSNVSLHVSRDPLTNISTKINGRERQCIIVNSNAKKKSEKFYNTAPRNIDALTLELWSPENFISQDQWWSPFVLISLRQWQNGHGSLLGRPHDGKVQTIFCYHGHHDLKLHHDKRQNFSMSISFDH